MSEFQRGDRAQFKQVEYELLSGQKGTVTHLDGDPGYKLGRRWQGREVWVEFDSGQSHWVPVELLVKIEG